MLSVIGLRDREEFGALRASKGLVNWPKYSRTGRISLQSGAVLAAQLATSSDQTKTKNSQSLNSTEITYGNSWLFFRLIIMIL